MFLVLTHTKKPNQDPMLFKLITGNKPSPKSTIKDHLKLSKKSCFLYIEKSQESQPLTNWRGHF